MIKTSQVVLRLKLNERQLGCIVLTSAIVVAFVEKLITTSMYIYACAHHRMTHLDSTDSFIQLVHPSVLYVHLFLLSDKSLNVNIPA